MLLQERIHGCCRRSRYMSSIKLTHIETNRLAKDLNFLITSKTVPNKNITVTVEDALKELEKEEADTIQTKISL